MNQRVQDFLDPLTNTLALIMTSPIQIVFCESGMLPFKTSLLPVFPYSSLTADEICSLIQIIEKTKCTAQRETMETSGQYTLTIHYQQGNSSSALTSSFHQQHITQTLATDAINNHNNELVVAETSAASVPLFVCKRKVLTTFIQVMLHKDNAYLNDNVCKTLCNIILQRLMARVPIPSNIIASVVEYIKNNGNKVDEDQCEKEDDEEGEKSDSIIQDFEYE